MAPVTRRSQAGAGVTKSASRKPRASPREASDSWELLDRAPASDDDDDNMQDEDNALLLGGADALQTITDRLGKEVESFAESLDRFFSDLPTAQNRFDAAHDLVLEFKDIAQEAVGELRKSHERERAEALRKEWSAEAGVTAMSGEGFKASLSTAKPTTGPMAVKARKQVEELRLFQEEADTWELFRLVLELHHNTNDALLAEEKREKLGKLGNVHRYTSENELYERFLAENDLAKERSEIKAWLEQTADHQRSDVPGIVAELEARAGTGAGLWSRGWMHSREKIKAEKRMRTWPAPDSSPLPQIRRDNNELLVTSLDPDAPVRQDRTLESQDAFYERALWIACWEMLRRGKPWAEICDWCEERKEGWRGVVMGRTLATSDAASNMAWRAKCNLASESETVGDYEAAVYGLLGGNVNAVNKISRSADDHLYAHYSAVLIQQFDQWIKQNYPTRAPRGLRRTSTHDGSGDRSIANPDTAQTAIVHLIYSLRKGAHTKRESISPIKMLQSYLLSNEAGSLIHTLGTAIADTRASANLEGAMTDRLEALVAEGSVYPEACIVTDMRSLRIATHICMVLKALRVDDNGMDVGELDAEDNVTEAYIQTLRTAGKYDLAAMYASKLRKERYKHALARVLEDVREPREREMTLNLIKELEMDAEAILWEHILLRVGRLTGGETATSGVRMLERIDENVHAYPGLRVKLGALPVDCDVDEEACVNSLQWFQQLRGHWELAFKALTLSLRTALSTNRFACARAIVVTYPTDLVAHNKSHLVLGHSANPAADDSSRPADERGAARWDAMLRQSRLYYQLEQLVKAFEALEAFRTAEHDFEHRRSGVASAIALRGPFEDAEAAMQPLLEPGFLRESADEEEAAALQRIRFAYLPEAIIAYETVLHSSGRAVTRDNFLKAMELSVAVAAEESGLAECLVQAGRMQELVLVLGRTSKQMLLVRGPGQKPWNPKKDRVGREPGIWAIGGRVGWDEGVVE